MNRRALYSSRVIDQSITLSIYCRMIYKYNNYLSSDLKVSCRSTAHIAENPELHFIISGLYTSNLKII